MPYRYSDAPSADNAIDINDGNGAIPACGNDLMMNRVYREQFLFSGFIVSDCDSIGEPSFEEYIGRRVSRSGPACDLPFHKLFVDVVARGQADTQNVSDLEKWYADAAAGVLGGCDLDCGRSYESFLPGALRSPHRWINRSDIDRSVSRITEHAIMLGLM